MMQINLKDTIDQKLENLVVSDDLMQKLLNPDEIKPIAQKRKKRPGLRVWLPVAASLFLILAVSSVAFIPQVRTTFQRVTGMNVTNNSSGGSFDILQILGLKEDQTPVVDEETKAQIREEVEAVNDIGTYEDGIERAHHLYNSLIEADKIWGTEEVSRQNISEIMELVKGDTRATAYLQQLLDDDFSSVVEAHNYFWTMLNGNVGKAKSPNKEGIYNARVSLGFIDAAGNPLPQPEDTGSTTGSGGADNSDSTAGSGGADNSDNTAGSGGADSSDSTTGSGGADNSDNTAGSGSKDSGKVTEAAGGGDQATAATDSSEFDIVTEEESDTENSDPITQEHAAQLVYDIFLSAESSTFVEDYNAKGFPYYKLQVAGEQRKLVPDRLSKNGQCYMFAYYSETESMLNYYVVNMYTRKVIASGKTSWADIGSEEYRDATGEPGP